MPTFYRLLIDESLIFMRILDNEWCYCTEGTFVLSVFFSKLLDYNVVALLAYQFAASLMCTL